MSDINRQIDIIVEPQSNLTVEKKENLKILEIGRGIDGVGVPTGGRKGQILVKNTNASYDTKWVNMDELLSSLIARIEELERRIEE